MLNVNNIRVVYDICRKILREASEVFVKYKSSEVGSGADIKLTN